MTSKTMIIISGLVDATIREYQPDIDFKMFKTIDSLASYLTKNPIRANTLFFTRDVLGGVNASLSTLRKLLQDDDYLNVDRVVYITEPESEELANVRYLIEEFEMDNWDIIEGSMSRAFITEVVNGTFRGDNYSTKHKAVYRRPRADYVKQQLRNKDSLEETYMDDDNDLGDIPDEEIPSSTLPEGKAILRRTYIAGNDSRERTAFALLAAQYISMTEKVVIIESDPDYHLLTEFATKAAIDCDVVTITDLYEDASVAIENIKKSEKNLIIIEAIDRIAFNYEYITTLLYYNLLDSIPNMIVEVNLDNIPEQTPVVIVTPSTITGVLSTAEKVDKSYVPNCRFVGVNLKDLPETHVDSGIVLSTICNDVLSSTGIICPVVTMSSLRLNGQAYDLGTLLCKEDTL